MEYRRLGNSGLQVSLLSLGSWVTFGNQIDDKTAEHLMKIAYDGGVNFFDNAETYANGKAELVMGKILKKMKWDRSTYLVSSKVFWGGILPNQYGLSRKHIVEACHAALKRLQVDYLDLYFCHRPDRNTPIEETVRAMSYLIDSGKILYWGTSEWSAQQISEAYGIARQYNLVPPTMEQPQYNMFHRERFEIEYHRLYSEIGLGTTIWSPLSSGLLTGKYKRKIKLLL
jgi:voltage-dependent potassium channel beta subunit